VLRAAQFAARFQFEIDEATVALCRKIDLSDLPPERIWGEIEKLLLLAKRPSFGFELLQKLTKLEKLFPEIASLVDVPQDPEWHPEGDVFVHTLLTIDRARELIEAELGLRCVFMRHVDQFFKKNEVAGDGSYTCTDHDAIPRPLLELALHNCLGSFAKVRQTHLHTVPETGQFFFRRFDPRKYFRGVHARRIARL